MFGQPDPSFLASLHWSVSKVVEYSSHRDKFMFGTRILATRTPAGPDTRLNECDDAINSVRI